MCDGGMVQPRDMFWALVLEEGKRYSQIVEQSFHISMAAVELPTDAEVLKGKHHQNVSVMVASQKSEFLICTLNFKHLTQQPLDLNFNEGEEVSFFINGQGTVHLTGYQLDGDNGLSDFGDFDEEEEESDTEVPELVPSKKRKNAVEAGLPKKKTKWLTPGGTEFSDDDSDEEDEESDDDDDDDMNATDLLDMEADEDSDDDFDDEDDDDDDDDDDSDEEIQEKKTPKVEEKKGQQTPKQEKKKEKQQTPKPEQSKTPKPAEQKTPKQDKKEQDQKKPGETPVSKLGAGGDAEAAQSGKKKKKKKKKKNKSLENGGDSPQEGKMSQPNTPKPGQNTPKPGQNTPKTGQNTPKPGQIQQTPKNKSEQGKTPKKQVLAGGIIAEDIRFGEGQPAKKGKMAHVYYVGKLQKDGKQFDSCTNGKPFKFKLGLGEVIQGWEKGLEGMKVGGKRRLTVPPQQGYGSQRQGPIPPNSTLVFEVELKNVS